MWREILTYNSAILVLNVQIEECVVVHLSYFIYKPKLNSFVETSQKKQTIRLLKAESNGISCLACKVVLDHSCAVFLPYIVVQNNRYCYLLCLDTNNEWILRYKFAVPKVLGRHIQLCDTSYTIENGPTLIWTVRDVVFIYKPEYSSGMNRPFDGILGIPLPSTACHGDIHTSILWWNSTACPEQGIIIFKNDEETYFYLVKIDEKMKPDVALSKPMIPSLYLAITSCTVCIPDQALLNECSVNSYRVFISTTQGQLLEFFEGKYKKHLNIPLVSCQSMRVYQRPCSNLILLCSQEEQICAVDWMSSKVLKTFQPFSYLLIDDFMGLGTSQALLVCDSKSKGPVIFDNFLLTDFCEIDVLKSEEDKKDHESSSSSVLMKSQSAEVEGAIDNVINALMKKMQASEASIIECEMEKSEKKSFLKRHCESLDKMLMNEVRPSLLQNCGLAQLVTGLVTKDTVAHAETSKIVVITMWQQILNSKWIIGVEIENVGSRSIHDVSLCTINKTRGVLTSSSKLQLSAVQNKEKHVVYSGQRATVIAITSLPKYLLEFTVGLMVTWKHLEQDEFLSLCCGDMTLCIDEIMNSAEKKCQGVAALHPMSTQAVVSSYDVPRAVTLLKSNLDICECSLPLQKYHFRYSPSSVIPHIEWTCANNALVMSFYTRDYDQVCWCLGVLKRQLTADATWRPLIHSSVLGLAITRFENEIRLRIGELDHLVKARAESIECYDVSEELSVKRRKLSQHNDSNKPIDLTMSRETLLDICSCLLCTENAFLTLFFLQ